MNKLPKYEECQEICRLTNSTTFYEHQTIIDGYDISVFNYRYATYEDFINFGGFELRGLTFVSDGNVWKPFPLLEKFFNLNENESTLLDKVKDSKIKSVCEKADGSIISFIKLPNGRVLAKSKTSFDSDQAKLAQSLFDSNKDVNQFVNSLLNEGLNPIFELVSPKNRIVVDYKTTELILLAVRDIEGNYIGLDNFDFKKTQKFNYNLDELLNLRTKLEQTEGWIVEFESGLKIKLKTEWYINLHHILTDYSKREDYLIDMILEEKLDDIISNLEVGSESYNYIKEVELVTNNRIKSIQSECDRLISLYDGDTKSFAVNYKTHFYFPIAIKIIRGYDKVEVIKEFIKRKTYRLSDARDWLLGG